MRYISRAGARPRMGPRVHFCALLLAATAVAQRRVYTITAPMLAEGGERIFWLGAPPTQVCYTGFPEARKQLELVLRSPQNAEFVHARVLLPVAAAACISFSAPVTAGVLVSDEANSEFRIVDPDSWAYMGNTLKFAVASVAVRPHSLGDGNPWDTPGTYTIKMAVTPSNVNFNRHQDRLAIVARDGSVTNCYTATLTTDAPPGEMLYAETQLAQSFVCPFKFNVPLPVRGVKGPVASKTQRFPVRFLFYSGTRATPVAAYVPTTIDYVRWSVNFV
jgi:hypothetical protein